MIDLGLDYSWGRPLLSQVVAQGYRFVSRYISYDQTGKNITPSERDAILAAGLELSLNWQWRGSWEELKGGAPVGREHATEAVRQAKALGYPQGCTVYYSIDFNAQEPGLSGAVSDYIRAAAEATRAAGYRMGAYGGYRTIRHMLDAGLVDDGWQTYAWSDGLWDPRAALRQVRNGVRIAGADVDINERHGTTYLMGGGLMRLLPHTTHVQDTGYYCGPASVLTALSARGIHVDEPTLARQLGTTTFGTNSSADVVRVLNSYLGAGTYRDVYIPGKGAEAHKAQLRTDLVAAVDAGYALVANVVGAARPLDGRTYSYPGGHYVAVVGYRADGAEALVTDVAVGRDYWLSTDALAVWIAGRGYATAIPTRLEADMATIVRNADDKQYYVLGPDGVARRLRCESANGISDVGYVASGRWSNGHRAAAPGLLPYSNRPIDKAPWIEIPEVPLGVLAVDDTPVMVEVGDVVIDHERLEREIRDAIADGLEGGAAAVRADS